MLLKGINYVFSKPIRFEEEDFKRYCLYGGVGFYKDSLSLEERLELINKFKNNSQICATILIDKLYKYEEERQILFKEVVKSSEITRLFTKYKFREGEREIAFKEISNPNGVQIHDWFLTYGNPTEEEKQIIFNIEPEEQSDYGCYMNLMHKRIMTEEKRIKTFNSVIKRSRNRDLRYIITAPHVCNPAWVPNDTQRKIAKDKLKEILSECNIYQNCIIERTYFGGKVIVKIPELNKCIETNHDVFIRKEMYRSPVSGDTVDVYYNNKMIVEARYNDYEASALYLNDID